MRASQVLDREVLDDFFARIGGVIHFAARTAFGDLVFDPSRYNGTNLKRKLILADAMRRAGVKSLDVFDHHVWRRGAFADSENCRLRSCEFRRHRYSQLSPCHELAKGHVAALRNAAGEPGFGNIESGHGSWCLRHGSGQGA